MPSAADKATGVPWETENIHRDAYGPRRTSIERPRNMLAKILIFVMAHVALVGATVAIGSADQATSIVIAQIER